MTRHFWTLTEIPGDLQSGVVRRWVNRCHSVHYVFPWFQSASRWYTWLHVCWVVSSAVGAPCDLQQFSKVRGAIPASIYALSSAKCGTFLHLIDATSITPNFVSDHNLRKPDEICQPSPIRCYCSGVTVSPSTISFELSYYRRPEAITRHSVVKSVRLVIRLKKYCRGN